MDTDVFSLESMDFMEMEQALCGWDHQYSQISPGAFRGNIFHTQTGQLGIFRNRWERVINYQGVAPEGTIGLAISLVKNGDPRWMGQSVAFDDLIVQRSGTQAEYISAPIWDSVVFSVPKVSLAQQIADITQEDPQDLIIHGIARITPQLAAQLRQASMGFLHTAARSLATPAATSTLPEMAESIVEMLARALVSMKPPRQQKICLIGQRRLIKKAEDYIAHAGNQPLRFGQLCRAINASERTLREAFYKVNNISPLAHLKALQLNRVYRVLNDAHPNDILIKQIAISNGFHHLGQFSHDYKQLFGELPSQTLSKV
jgi:AraC family ethanolamine operon transcriptional activator